MPTRGTIIKAVVPNHSTPTNSTSDNSVTINDMKSLPENLAFVARQTSIQAAMNPVMMNSVVQVIGNCAPLNSGQMDDGLAQNPLGSRGHRFACGRSDALGAFDRRRRWIGGDHILDHAACRDQTDEAHIEQRHPKISGNAFPKEFRQHGSAPSFA